MKIQSSLLAGKLYRFCSKSDTYTVCGGSNFYDSIHAKECVMVLSHEVIEDDYGIKHDVEVLSCDGIIGKIVARCNINLLFELIEF